MVIESGTYECSAFPENEFAIAYWTPELTQFFFILSCVAVPILWGVVVNWLFGRLQRGKSATNKIRSPTESNSESEIDQEEPRIEYYI